MSHDTASLLVFTAIAADPLSSSRDPRSLSRHLLPPSPSLGRRRRCPPMMAVLARKLRTHARLHDLTARNRSRTVAPSHSLVRFVGLHLAPLGDFPCMKSTPCTMHTYFVHFPLATIFIAFFGAIADIICWNFGNPLLCLQKT